MPVWLNRSLAYLGRRWRVWAPPFVLTIVVFVAVVFLTKGRTAMPFLYRLF
jgi:hypothetical protein